MSDSDYNCVYILQSLQQGEKQTGARLHEDIEALIVSTGKNFQAFLREIRTRKDFFDTLREIAVDVSTGARPILQIECHGSKNKDGLILCSPSSVSFVSWGEMRKAITPINKMCNLNLLLMIGACNGAHAFGSLLVESVLNAEPAACWGVWGPVGDINPDPLFSAQMTFYRDLFNDSGERDPLRKALLSARPIGSLFFSSAQTCFEQAKKQYFENYCSSRQLKKRAKTSADTHEMQTGVRKTTKEIEQAIKNTGIQHFKTCREKFFMIDTYPENEARFADRSK